MQVKCPLGRRATLNANNSMASNHSLHVACPNYRAMSAPCPWFRQTVKGTSKLVYGTNRDRVLSMLKPHIPSDSAHMRGVLQCVQIVFTPIAD